MYWTRSMRRRLKDEIEAALAAGDPRLRYRTYSSSVQVANVDVHKDLETRCMIHAFQTVLERQPFKSAPLRPLCLSAFGFFPHTIHIHPVTGNVLIDEVVFLLPTSQHEKMALTHALTGDL